jgi:transposase
MEKRDARKLSTDAQQELREIAIRLKKSGMTYKEISGITDVQLTTVCQWWKAYERCGKNAIDIKKRGRPTGTCRTLSTEQEKELQKAIQDNYPDQLKIPFALWSRAAVQQLIRQFYSIDMPIRTVGEYLKRWNFTPQKPLRKAYRQNPKAVEKWISEEYPTIAGRAEKEKAEIRWGDETGLCNDSYFGRSYAPCGQTPAIRLRPGCQRINLISTVTNQGKVRFMIYKDKMNAQTLIQFMKRLIKDSHRKKFLILDNLKVHHSNIVREWQKTHKKKIGIFFLPSYSPELNPDEYLNCDLKVGVHSGTPARTENQLKKKAFSHLKMLQKKTTRVKNYFLHPKISYAA